MKFTMKKFFVFALIALSINANSQNVTIRNGASFKMGTFEYVEDVLSISRNQGSVLLRAGIIGNKFRVLNLDGNLGEKSKFEVEIPKIDNKKLRYFWSGQLGSSVYFMSSHWDRKASTYSIYASELDPNNGQFKSHKPVVQVTDDKFTGFGGNPSTAVRSNDSTKVLFVTPFRTKGAENARYNMKVVNNDMSEVWSKDIEFNELDKNFTMLTRLVDKDGNVHFVASIKMSRDEKKEKGSASRYYVNIYSYYHKTGELKQYEVGGFADQVIQSIHMRLDDNNQLVGTGFYTEKAFWQNGYKGFFYLRIDPSTKEVVASTLSPFGKELMTEIIGERKAEKGKEMPPYEIRKAISLADGKMAVVAENYAYTYSEDDKGNTRETWLYGNALVIFVDADGKMTSGSVLKKKQFCTAKNGNPTLLQRIGIGVYPGVNELPYYGIGIMESKDNVYIVYNENPKNEAIVAAGKNPKSVRQKTAVTNLVTFTPDGKMMTNTLFKAKDNADGYKMPLMPRSSVQFADNEMVVFGRKGKNFRVAAIKID
jgi:hypothetical protein